MSRMLSHLALVAVLLSCCSCVSRQLTIESDPPGARVLMERKEIGTTPLTFDFEYGGVREFLLLHEEGDIKYAPVRVRHDSEEFFLDTFPFDILSRLQPVSIERDFVVRVELEESILTDMVQDDEESYIAALLNRAEQLRERARIQQANAPPANDPYLPPLEPGLRIREKEEYRPNVTPNVSKPAK